MRPALLTALVALTLSGLAERCGAQDMHVSACGPTPTSSPGASPYDPDLGAPYGKTVLHAFRSAHVKPAILRADKGMTELFLDGVIVRKNVKQVLGALQRYPNIAQLTVNSFGGQAEAAMEIAGALAQRRLRLVVSGFCMSACANYLLPAATSVSLDDAVIGLHGSPSTCDDQLSILGGLRAWGLSNYREFRRIAEIDRAFPLPAAYRQVVALSQRADRGGLDEHARSWLLIHPTRLKTLGVPVTEVGATTTSDAIAADPQSSFLGPVKVY